MHLLLLAIVAWAQPALAQTDAGVPADAAPSWSDPVDAGFDAAALPPEPPPEPPVEDAPPPSDEYVSPIELEEEEPASRVFETEIRGFVAAFFQQEGDQPAGIDPMTGVLITEPSPYEFDVLAASLIAHARILDRFDVEMSIESAGAGSNIDDEALSLRTAWVEVPVVGEALEIRLGKMWRRFGLYNEVLDALPSYIGFIGILPPEIFDEDHLMITRSVNLMVHGRIEVGNLSALRYALMSGNEERGDNVPIGGDLRFESGDTLTIGASGYWSGGAAPPSRGMGEGSPKGGVVNWMVDDDYWLVGGYLQLQIEGWLLQLEGWHAQHNGTRDPERVGTAADQPDTLAANFDSILPVQRQRFWADPSAIPAGAPATVLTDADYVINTFYVRTLYEFTLGGEAGTLAPYAQYDFYSNPELIGPEDFGGDNEAGDADTGLFHKITLGVVYRPFTPVTLKLDGAIHIQTVNGQTYVYPEVHTLWSFQWELEL